MRGVDPPPAPPVEGWPKRSVGRGRSATHTAQQS